MAKHQVIQVNGVEISLVQRDKVDFISLTDITSSYPEGSGLIGKWISNKNTLEYLGIWEKINNPEFNYPEFGVIEQAAGTNRFIMSAGQWIQRTMAQGLIVKAGRYGGTYAHKDIAFHFAMWLSPEFQIYLIKEFQRLKEEESEKLNLGWNFQRALSKVNYRIHTDAIRELLLPTTLTTQQINQIYASEADLLNVAVFGQTAKEWRDGNPEKAGNIREYAAIEQLVILSNLESINSLLIRQGHSQSERLLQLNGIAISQMKSLLQNPSIKKLT